MTWPKVSRTDFRIAQGLASLPTRSVELGTSGDLVRAFQATFWHRPCISGPLGRWDSCADACGMCMYIYICKYKYMMIYVSKSRITDQKWLAFCGSINMLFCSCIHMANISSPKAGRNGVIWPWPTGSGIFFQPSGGCGWYFLDSREIFEKNQLYLLLWSVTMVSSFSPPSTNQTRPPWWFLL